MKLEGPGPRDAPAGLSRYDESLLLFTKRHTTPLRLNMSRETLSTSAARSTGPVAPEPESVECTLRRPQATDTSLGAGAEALEIDGRRGSCLASAPAGP